jgi:UDP-N-acetylmuramate--alanine ligase
MSLIAKTRKVHFIGIGGIGMSGLAELLLKLGHRVTGSDANDSETVQRLRALGALVQVGHNEAIVRDSTPDVVVFSTAIASANPEIVFAREKNIPIIRRAEMLGEIMRLKRGIAIAGSHGKTTTTGLVSLLLRAAGLDPTVVIGGRFDAIGSNAAWGGGQWVVAEADESDGSFLRLTPELGVVTNIDREHLDHYKSFEAACEAFEDFLDRLPFYGRAILCSDCPNLRAMAPSLRKPRFWYGFDSAQEPDFWVKILSEGAQSNFEIYKKSNGYATPWMQLQVSVPGRHNVLNAAAAALVATELEVSPDVIRKALLEFHGVRRRFDRRGEWRGHPVIEDYAHHPTEIRATLQAARSVFGALKPLVIFQPHRYSRTRDLWSEFATCFAEAGHVVTLPIYAASEPREAWVDSFDGANFAKNIKHTKVDFYPDRDALLVALDSLELPAGTPLLVLGAGDVSKLIPELIASAGDSA